MKHFRLILPRGVGSPLAHAVRLVRLVSRFHSTVLLKCNGEIADILPAFFIRRKRGNVDELVETQRRKNLIPIIEFRRERVHADGSVALFFQFARNRRYAVARQLAVRIESMNAECRGWNAG